MTSVRSPVLIGRANEQARLGTALLAAREGHGSMVVVSGEAGIGKSRLASELTTRARASGMRVATGRASSGTGRFALRPLGEAVQSVVREHGPPRDPKLRPFRPVLAPFVPAWAAVESVEELAPGLVLLEAITRLLVAVAEANGLLLIIEDVHWADEDTLTVLDHLADELDQCRILCLCTHRSGTTGPGSDWIAELVNRRAAERIDLGRLTAGEIEELAQFALGVESVPEAALGVLLRRSEGVPFVVEEMLSAWSAAEGRPEAGAEWWLASKVASALPPSLRDLARTRLDSLPDEASRVVKAAAVLGRTFDWSLLAPIVGLDRQATLTALGEAVAVHLLVGEEAPPGRGQDAQFAFRHALMREAVLAEVLPHERSDLSLRAADAVEDLRPGLPGEWCEVTAALREQGGDSLGATRLLMESARRSLRAGAVGTAEASLQRARVLAGDDYMLWMGIDELLVEALARAGRTADLAAKTRQLVDGWERDDRRFGSSYAKMLSAERRFEIHLRAARVGLATGELDYAREQLGYAESFLADEAMAIRLQAVRAGVAWAAGALEEARADAHATMALATALESREAQLECRHTLALVARERDDVDGARTQFELLLEEAEAASANSWRVRSLHALGAIDARQQGQVDLLGRARTAALEVGAIVTATEARIEFVRLHADQGRLTEALAAAEAAVDTCRRLDLPLLNAALLAQGRAAALAGKDEIMGAVLDELAQSTLEADVAAAIEGDIHATAALTREDLGSARRHLDVAVASLARWRHGRPSFFGLAALLRAMAGDASATALPDHRGHHVMAAYAGWSHAVNLGLAGDGEAAATAAALADDIMPAGWRRHMARRLVAQAQLDNEWGDPVPRLQEALAFFEEHVLQRSADKCRDLLRRAGVPTSRTRAGSTDVPRPLAQQGITRREAEVLELVADGASNQEIADMLFLSPRTVETHVRNAMRKLDIHSRPELVAFAIRHAGDANTRDDGRTG